ncbi:ATP-binding protein [Pedobacter yulinensis]|nr:ATP-binding protein [Pedobacter yulinensis]
MTGRFSKLLSSGAGPGGGTSLLEAQLRLFYLMLGANIIKGGIYLYDAVYNHAGKGSVRSIRLMVTSALLILLLRRFPRLAYWGIHYAVIGTILHIYYRAFNVYTGSDVVTVQCIFMVVISAFYGLGRVWGAVYTVIAAAGVVLVHYIGFRWTGLQPLPGMLSDLYVAINFLVILLSHWYFHRVLFDNLEQSASLSKRLAEVAETKSNFLSTMSHELRTPLNSVIGIAGLLIADNANAKQKEQLDVLKYSAEGLLTLINDILDINKLESGKLELESTPFSLSRLIHNIGQGMKFKADEKALAFKVSIDPRLSGKYFSGDPARLNQIMYNLVGNAIKFTEAGEVEMSAAVLDATDGGYTIRFAVRDTGIGISESQQKHIFEPFQQASVSTTRKFGGTGLGLAIVRQLVEMFGSEIHLESRPGKGTQFHFDLRLEETEPIISETQAAAAVTEELDLSRLRILLAEDNMMNIFFMQQLFRRWNISADIAENGEEVLALMEKKDFDLILMDMHMPVLDGMEATKRIRQLEDPKKASTYIIALTASVSDQIQRRVIECGMDDYLHKPFQLEELRTRLASKVV